MAFLLEGIEVGICLPDPNRNWGDSRLHFRLCENLLLSAPALFLCYLLCPSALYYYWTSNCLMWNAFAFFPDPDPSVSSCLSHSPMPPNILPPLTLIVVVVIGSISMTQAAVLAGIRDPAMDESYPVMMPSDLHVRKISLNISDLICAMKDLDIMCFLRSFSIPKFCRPWKYS